MKKFFVKSPWWLKKLYPHRIWHVATNEKIIYLTFDDGPHPVATPFVLNELKKYNARATFFCIGKNAASYPEIYQRILQEGHQVGNHTYNHLNGWKTDNNLYLENINKAAEYITSNLFRPPYGRLRSSQAKELGNYKIVMWDVLSGDFEPTVSKETCLRNVTAKTENGSIVVFHDSEKAWEKLHFALPEVLKHFSALGYRFLSIY
jgi:peptidoglycan/xylan/chitin deacetylase (PgdA/CDA1 family)